MCLSAILATIYALRFVGFKDITLSGVRKDKGDESTVPTLMSKEPVTSAAVVHKHHNDQRQAVERTQGILI